MKLYSADEMTRTDQGAQSLGIPGGVLMERAGVGMARATLDFFGSLVRRRILVVAGGGNNGGDGFVVARELHRAGARVAVLATREDYEGDTKTNYDLLGNLNVRFIEEDEYQEELDRTDLIVDALLGTGFSGEVREKEAGLIEKMNASRAPVVSIDVPSGVDGSTGEVWGAAVLADLTVCAHAAKLGCVVSPGYEYAGEVVVVDIGVPPEADERGAVSWMDADALRGVVPRRAGASHKYSAGSLLIVAGSIEATGAAIMAARGAQRTGCGIIFVVTSWGVAPLVDAQLTEVLVSGAPENDDGTMTEEAMETILEKAQGVSAIVAGPAMGVGKGGQRLVEGILQETSLPVLLDADGISNLSGAQALAGRDAPVVITPHPGELGRLLDQSPKEIQARRLYSAHRTAEEGDCCVLLKGADTIVVEGDRASINSSGGPQLATAGTGDVLSGIVGALLARGAEAYDAARAGAWAHGRAAELWLEATEWPRESMTATDLLPHLPQALAEIY